MDVTTECFRSLQQLTITNIKADGMLGGVFIDRGYHFHTRFRRQELTLASEAGELKVRLWASNVADPVVVDVDAALRMNNERSPPGSLAVSRLSRAEALLLKEFPFLYKVGDDFHR